MAKENTIFCDFNDQERNSYKKVLSGLSNRLENAQGNNDILLNLENVFFSNSFKNELGKILMKNRDCINGVAAYGIGKGVRRLIIEILDAEVYIADDREDAEDWLSMRSEVVI